MNVIKFMNRLLCLEQVSLKYMQMALSIAVLLLRRQPGIVTYFEIGCCSLGGTGWGSSAGSEAAGSSHLLMQAGSWTVPNPESQGLLVVGRVRELLGTGAGIGQGPAGLSFCYLTSSSQRPLKSYCHCSH